MVINHLLNGMILQVGVENIFETTTFRTLFFFRRCPLFSDLPAQRLNIASEKSLAPAAKTHTQERTLFVSISQTQVLNSSDLLVVFLKYILFDPGPVSQ